MQITLSASLSTLKVKRWIHSRCSKTSLRSQRGSLKLENLWLLSSSLSLSLPLSVFLWSTRSGSTSFYCRRAGLVEFSSVWMKNRSDIWNTLQPVVEQWASSIKDGNQKCSWAVVQRRREAREWRKWVVDEKWKMKNEIKRSMGPSGAADEKKKYIYI